MDEALGRFISDFGELVRLSAENARGGSGTAIRDFVRKHLDADPGEFPVVIEPIQQLRLVDTDVVLDEIAGRDPSARGLGVGGGQMRMHADLRSMLDPSPVGRSFPAVAQPDYSNASVGPSRQRRTLQFGLRLFRYDGTPVAVLQRGASPNDQRFVPQLEVIATDEDAVSRLFAELRGRLERESVFKGQVVLLSETGFGPGRAPASGGITFVDRPHVADAEVILAPGVLPRIREHALGVGRHAAALSARGQHLKRGLLLYGPPGTGKTHTVRHLIGASEGTTVLMMSGRSLARISEAAQMARALTPSIVVLEDVDLVAEDRSFGPMPQPLLFEILDALDGLDGDADIAFVLTTNRVDVLERALSQRPGRVDLAVELPLPGLDERRALLALYGGGLGFSDVALERAAGRIEGTTASLAKELVRRAVLGAAEDGSEPEDRHLDDAAAALMAESEALTRTLLGSHPAGTRPPRPTSPTPPASRTGFPTS
ncbi:AAA family ATPase [Sinomonas albida]|uniref:AAA family ATPase n=1 Tax=Sinomonas albida TaxID=369942 RepID=UPI0010A8EB1D|nr:ATP-binding protein [Sinomonas albida]